MPTNFWYETSTVPCMSLRSLRPTLQTANIEKNNAHWLDDSEKHALTKEHARRHETMAGFGYARSEPALDEQRRRETDHLIGLMSSRWLQIHSEYIMQGSGAYNDYQREAVAREMQRRPTAVMIRAGVHLDEDEEMMDD